MTYFPTDRCFKVVDISTRQIACRKTGRNVYWLVIEHYFACGIENIFLHDFLVISRQKINNYKNLEEIFLGFHGKILVTH